MIFYVNLTAVLGAQLANVTIWVLLKLSVKGIMLKIIVMIIFLNIILASKAFDVYLQATLK